MRPDDWIGVSWISAEIDSRLAEFDGLSAEIASFTVEIDTKPAVLRAQSSGHRAQEVPGSRTGRCCAGLIVPPTRPPSGSQAGLAVRGMAFSSPK